MSDRDAASALAGELIAESAASLGRAGRRLEDALAALGAHPRRDHRRAELVDAAAYYAWSYVCLRGALGWADDDDALRVYAVPPEVRARIGAVRAPPGDGVG
jgi:hypothetical protein